MTRSVTAQRTNPYKYLLAMTNEINEIKDILKKYQTTLEYKKKRQFDLYFQGNDDYPIGIYEYKNDVFKLTANVYGKSIESFSQDVIEEIYKQVGKN